jgi:hypothetical protein
MTAARAAKAPNGWASAQLQVPLLQYWLMQSPPPPHVPPKPTAAQVPPLQDPLQQSVFVTQGGPVVGPLLTHPHVLVLPLQNPLVQSPPLPHGLPVETGLHVPPWHEPLVQSLLAVQVPPAATGAQVLPLQNPLQQSPPLTQAAGGLTHAFVVDVVALTHVADVANVVAVGQFAAHAVPAGQHRRTPVLVQGVLPAGHPHSPLVRSIQAMPALQHFGPHGVVPLGQQHEVVWSEHEAPLGQHPWPHVAPPLGQATAPPLIGRRTAAAAAAAPVAPSTFSAPRREVLAAIARDRSSKDPLTLSPAPRLDRASIRLSTQTTQPYT